MIRPVIQRQTPLFVVVADIITISQKQEKQQNPLQTVSVYLGIFSFFAVSVMYSFRRGPEGPLIENIIFKGFCCFLTLSVLGDTK